MTDSLNRVPVPQLIEYAPQVIAEPDTGFGEAFGAARDLTSITRAGAGILDESAFEADPNWKLDVQGYLGTVDPQYHAVLRNVMPKARSAAHMDYLRDRTMEEVDALQKVGEYTNGSVLGSLGMFMGASMTDIPTLAANVVAGAGALRTVVNGVRLTRLQRAMRGAAFEGSVNVGLEAVLAAGNPTSDLTDVVIAGFAGAAFGAGLGGIGRGYAPGTVAETTNAQLTKVGNDALDAVAKEDLRKVAPEAAVVPEGVKGLNLLTGEDRAQAAKILEDIPFSMRRDVESDAQGVVIGAQTRLDEAFDLEHLTDRNQLPYMTDGLRTHGQDLYDAYAPVREQLRAKHGDTITLSRAEAPEGEHITGKHTLNWATPDAAKKIWGEDFYQGERTIITEEIPVDDIIAVHVSGKQYEEVIVLNRKSKGYYDPTQKQGIDWKVRSAEQLEIERTYEKAIQMQEAKLEEMGKVALPDEPVAPKMREGIDGFKEELAFLKTLPELKLSKKDALRASVEFNKAKSQFMEDFRDADPDAFQQIFGNRDRLNPPTKELEEKLPQIEKAIAKMEKRFEKEQATYAGALDRLGAQKDEALEAIDALKAELKASQRAYRDSARSVGAAEAADAAVTGGADLLGPKYYAEDSVLRDMPEMRHGIMWGEHQLPGAARTRIDLASWVDHSPNDEVRATGRGLFQDANTKMGHATNPMSATEESAKVQEGLMGLYQSTVERQFPAWLEEQGVKWGRGKDILDYDGKMVRQFHEEVTDAVEAGSHESPSVMEAAKAWQEAMGRAKEYWEESDMPGSGTFPTDPSHIPRRVSDNSLTELNAHYEVADQLSPGVKNGLSEMYYRAIMKANPTFDTKKTAMITNHIAQNQLKRVGRIGVHSVADLGRMTRETLEDFLEEMGVPESARRDFYDMVDLESTKDDAGRIGPAKRRMHLDTNHEPVMMEYTGPATATLQPGQMVPRQLGDIMERNADLLLTGYANQMVGWGAIHRYFPNIYNQSSLDTHLDNIRKFEMDVVKDPNRLSNRVMGASSPLEADIHRLQLGFRDALGHSMVDDPHSGLAATRRGLTGWGVARLMGQTVFPQMTEASKVITASSMKTVMHHMPIVKDYVNTLRSGKPLSKDMAILHQMSLDYGIGTNFSRGGAPNRYSTDMDGAMFTKQDKWAYRLNKAKSITTAPLRVAMDMQELLAAKSLQTDFAAAWRKGDVSEAMGKRLRFMGVSPAMEKRIRKQVLKHAKDEKGGKYADSSSEFVGDFNLNDWDDPKARDVWELGMKRRVGEIVQSNNVGNLPGWAFSDFGQMFAQFRTFTLAAFPKQLLNTMSYGDVQAVYTMMLNSVFAATGYAAQKALSSVGRDDAEEFRDRYITPEKMALAAWERSAWASFTPIAGDVLSFMATGEVMSPYSKRSTGLEYGIEGIPAVDLLNSTMDAYNSVFGAIHGKNSAQDAYDSVRGLLFFQNLLGVQNVLNYIGSQIPD